MTIPFFDGHNDALFRLAGYDHPAPEQLFLSGRPDGHIDLPRARRGGMIGGFFALYAESTTGSIFRFSRATPTARPCRPRCRAPPLGTRWPVRSRF